MVWIWWFTVCSGLMIVCSTVIWNACKHSYVRSYVLTSVYATNLKIICSLPCLLNRLPYLEIAHANLENENTEHTKHLTNLSFSSDLNFFFSFLAHILRGYWKWDKNFPKMFLLDFKRYDLEYNYKYTTFWSFFK